MVFRLLGGQQSQNLRKRNHGIFRTLLLGVQTGAPFRQGTTVRGVLLAAILSFSKAKVGNTQKKHAFSELLGLDLAFSTQLEGLPQVLDRLFFLAIAQFCNAQFHHGPDLVSGLGVEGWGFKPSSPLTNILGPQIEIIIGRLLEDLLKPEGHVWLCTLCQRVHW